MVAEKAFWVTSMYGMKNQAPLVTLTVPDGGMHQMSPDEARSLAANLVHAAEASEQDGFIIEWAQQKLGLDLEQATMVLGDYRDWRQARQ